MKGPERLTSTRRRRAPSGMSRQLCPGSQVFEARAKNQPADLPRIWTCILVRRLLRWCGVRSLLLFSILLAVPTACNQSLTPPNMTGTGGTETGAGGGDGGSGPGTGGTTPGTGGLGGSNVSQICNALVAEYQSSLTAAETCQVGASGQCQQIAAAALSGCYCQTYVTDSSALSVIEENWQAAGCAEQTTVCVSGCPAALNTTCVPTDGGSVGFCSYVPGTGGTSGNDGTGGSGGGATGGTTGAGGSAVDGGLSSCGTLASEYAAVLVGAKSCTAGADGQCGKQVPSSLSPCASGCAELVTDSSVLDTIQQRWEAAGCANVEVLCPLIACAPPTGAACVASDAGGSVCSTSYGSILLSN